MNISENITRLIGAHVNITELAQLIHHSDLIVKTARTQARALQSPHHFCCNGRQNRSK